MSTPTSFVEASRIIAQKFLQSVVLIDDKAFFGEESTPEPTTGLIAPGHAHAQPTTEQAGKTTEANPISDNLNAKLIIEAFAERGLVCAVLKPEPEQALDLKALLGQTLPAVRRSDIVILDWVLDRFGTNALETIERIIKEDIDKSVGLRLIAIYTGLTELNAITEQLEAKLEGFDRPTGDEHRFELTNGQVHITVYAKESTTLPQEQRNRIRTITDLPDALIADYAKMTTGLVSNVALAALAALRQHTHLLLGKMNTKLDPPYLAHRVMLPHPDDAIDHLVNLIGAELQSILDQAEIGKEARLERIKLWLEAENLDYPKCFPNVKSDDWQEEVLRLLEKGHSHLDIKNKFSIGNTRKLSAKQFCNVEDTRDVECEFGMLTTLRSRYDSLLPTLKLGQILLENREQESKYWMCLQPTCDSMRIKGTRNFPLLPMQVDEKEGDFVIKRKDEYIKLKVIYHPYECRMVCFQADPSTEKVVGNREENGEVAFVSTDEVRFEWIAQLKPESAQHVANEYASSISRVGRNVSEWLRSKK